MRGGKGILVGENCSFTLSTLRDEAICYETRDKQPSACYAIEGNGARPSHMGQGFSEDGGVMFTLNTAERHSVCYAIENHPQDGRAKIKDDCISETLTARCGTGGGNVPMTLLGNGDGKYVVRRLTPLECGRLQGFPDWWTDGTNGSDSNIYKMWGNGVALNCAADVIGRLAKELQGGE